MKRKSIGTDYSMCVQPTFLIGTYNEDGQANFAPITWVSATYDGKKYFITVSIYGNKLTKQNILRTKQLSVNLVSTDMLDLVDYFGDSSLKNSEKTNISFSYTASDYVQAPLLDLSRWVYECEVSETTKFGESDTFFCSIKNIQIDENIKVGNTFEINLVPFEPVVYSGQYHSIGNHLGQIGDFYKKSYEKL